MTTVVRLCALCHAQVANEAAQSCPVCGGRLVADPHAKAALAGGSAPSVDHRGIVLPPRHAVGGVITPR